MSGKPINKTTENADDLFPSNFTMEPGDRFHRLPFDRSPRTKLPKRTQPDAKNIISAEKS